MFCDGVRDQGLIVAGGKEAASDATEEEEAQVNPDMIIEHPVTAHMVVTEGAEPGIYWSRKFMVVDHHFPGCAQASHRWLRHQVVETNVMVVPIVFIPDVNHLTVAPLQALDKIQGLDDWSVQFKEVPGSITVEGFVNDGLHGVCLLIPAVFPYPHIFTCAGC